MYWGLTYLFWKYVAGSRHVPFSMSIMVVGRDKDCHLGFDYVETYTIGSNFMGALLVSRKEISGILHWDKVDFKRGELQQSSADDHSQVVGSNRGRSATAAACQNI